MSRLLIIAALLCVPFIAFTAGCQNTGAQSGTSATTQPSAASDQTVRLTLVLNAYNSAEETLTQLSKQGLIPVKDKPAISAAVHAARAAIDSAYAHKDDNQSILAAAIDQATAAVLPVLQFVANHPPKGGS